MPPARQLSRACMRTRAAVRGSGAEPRRLLRGCSGAVALRVVCPAQITAGVPDYAVGPKLFIGLGSQDSDVLHELAPGLSCADPPCRRPSTF